MSGGTQYWSASIAGDTNTFSSWEFNSTSQTGFISSSYDGGASWNGEGCCPITNTGAFDVLGKPVTPTPVAEPASILLLGTGVFTLVGGRFRRRRT
jgi:hypothetical protein